MKEMRELLHEGSGMLVDVDIPREKVKEILLKHGLKRHLEDSGSRIPDCIWKTEEGKTILEWDDKNKVQFSFNFRASFKKVAIDVDIYRLNFFYKKNSEDRSSAMITSKIMNEFLAETGEFGKYFLSLRDKKGEEVKISIPMEILFNKRF